ncbi:MAG TPA: DUF6458 family protein [Streptosporangiaceae bacterium]|nr:DUF6458 family protein [Streptosporangiaceae bacterium]
MRLGTGLTIIAIGAILAFAVQSSPSWFNIQIAGWVIIVTGVVGLALSRSDYRQWVRRVVIRRPASSTVVQRDGESPPRALRSGRNGTRPEPRPTAEAPDHTIPGRAEQVEERTEYYRD